MFRILFISLLGYLVHSGASGQILNGSVTDSETGEALPYAHILIEGFNAGEVGNSDGSFSINISETDPNDTLLVRMIGYETMYFTIGDLDLNEALQVEMNQKVYELSSVTIQDNASSLMIGTKKKSRSYTGWGDIESSKGRARGLALSDIPCPSRVKSMGFRLKHNDWDSVAFRLSLMTINHDEPDSSIQTEDIILIASGSNKWFEYPLEKYNIMLCNQIIVALEWVDAWGKTGTGSNLLTFTLSNKDGLVYRRNKGEATGRLKEEKDVPGIYLEVFN